MTNKHLFTHIFLALLLAIGVVLIVTGLENADESTFFFDELFWGGACIGFYVHMAHTHPVLKIRSIMETNNQHLSTSACRKPNSSRKLGPPHIRIYTQTNQPNGKSP